MTIMYLYATVTGCSNILSINLSDSHIASTANAVIQCKNTSLTLGDFVEIDLGYTTNHRILFKGYVKNIQKKTPDGIFTVTCDNILIRAVEYFIASSNPNEPFTRSNITAEDLVADVLALAGLTDFAFTATSFTFGVNSPVEVNLVSAYDFCKLITDILSWHLYADTDGVVNFVNRKPYVMDGSSGQPGDIEDEPVKTITGKLQLIKSDSEKDLRNRIVVYGRDPISAEASEVSPYLPDGFFKTTVVASEWIDTEQVAQDAADYNLELLNRLTQEGNITIVGDPDLTARDVVTVVDTITTISGNYYIYSCEHIWGSTGYTTALGLRA